jgi:hypothetical protein
MIETYWLHATPYDQIAKLDICDPMLNFGEEAILSTITIRHAGFGDSIDTHISFKRQLTRLREIRIFDISRSSRPKNWATAGGSEGYRAVLTRSQFTPGPISSFDRASVSG